MAGKFKWDIFGNFQYTVFFFAAEKALKYTLVTTLESGTFLCNSRNKVEYSETFVFQCKQSQFPKVSTKQLFDLERPEKMPSGFW